MTSYLISGEVFDCTCSSCLDPISGEAVIIGGEHYHPICSETIAAEWARDEEMDRAIAATFNSEGEQMMKAAE